MKKILLIGCIMLTGLAYPDFSLFYYTSWGFADGSDPTGNTPLLPNTGDKALVQLLYAGDNGVADFFQGTTTLNIGGGAEGDDILLDQVVFENTGQPEEEWALFGKNINTDYLGSGKVYARIFNTENAGFGSKFYVGHVQTMTDLDLTRAPVPLPELYDLGQSVDALANNSIPLHEFSVIPEPTTLPMIGTGLVFIYLYRKKRAETFPNFRAKRRSNQDL